MPAMVEEQPPALPPKDNIPTSASSNDLQEYLKRSTTENVTKSNERLNSLTSGAASIFSYSKSSLSSQLSGLTSMTLPQAESLAATVSALPTAPKAARQLTVSATEIKKWTQAARRVLTNLDADDDVEWAAAAGRDALDDVDKAITRFETLIEVYVQAIEELQARPDVADVDAGDLKTVVEQMEMTLSDWDTVRRLLKNVHDQVDLAMEWEELWGIVLGDVGNEIEGLEQLIFEMEERRHMTMKADVENQAGSGIDIDELETIVEDSPTTAKTPASNRFSIIPSFAPSPASPAPPNPQDDQSLLALFARMQPLRASLDFLPMRLAMFQARAEKIFPSACAELEERRARLEHSWKELEKEAEILRRELGEDRWIIVFRNAGRQAQKMIESVERSLAKLEEALETGMQHNNPSQFAKKVESFEAKKMHYGPAIDRVMSIIQKGVKDRLTVNGEILRLQIDLTGRTEAMHEQMNAMQTSLEYMNEDKNSQIRDSISTLLSMDRSVASSMLDTPGSSPASSVVMSGSKDSTPLLNGGRLRARSGSRTSATQRLTSLTHNKRTSSQYFSSPTTRLASPSPSATSRTSATPTPGRRPPSRTAGSLDNRPRWNGSANTNDLRIGHNFKPLSTTNPSPYRNTNLPRPASRSSSIPLRSPLSRETVASPAPTPITNGRTIRPPSRTAGTGTSFRDRVTAGQTATSRSSLLSPVPYSKVSRNVSAPVPSTRTNSQSAANTSKPLPPITPNTARTISYATPGTKTTVPQRPPSSLLRSRPSGIPRSASRAGAESPSLPPPGPPVLSPPVPPASEIEDPINEETEFDLPPSSPPLLPSSPSISITSSPLATIKSHTPSKPRLNKRASMLPIPSSSGNTPTLANPGTTRSASSMAGRRSSMALRNVSTGSTGPGTGTSSTATITATTGRMSSFGRPGVGVGNGTVMGRKSSSGTGAPATANGGRPIWR